MEKKFKSYRFQVNVEKDRDIIEILERVPKYFRSRYILDALRNFEFKDADFSFNKKDTEDKKHKTNLGKEQNTKVDLNSQEGNNQLYDKKETVVTEKKETQENKPSKEIDLTKIFV